jgi:hypothetical protein
MNLKSSVSALCAVLVSCLHAVAARGPAVEPPRVN